jgi:hypothetical protein
MFTAIPSRGREFVHSKSILSQRKKSESPADLTKSLVIFVQFVSSPQIHGTLISRANFVDSGISEVNPVALGESGTNTETRDGSGK